ncbi:MAG: methyl-accepting chemotaxis protein, partial [Pseudorhodoplanes sp.]|nr:methyl-accepting chemotaxis protein [Pseudorhodoplanes sp.]
MTVLRLSIAGKLYAIFGLLAGATLALAAFAIVNSRQHAATTARFESAFLGSINVERVNALIYAVVMDSRGVYMAPDVATAKRFGDGLLRFNERISAVIADWRSRVGPEDRAQFEAFAERIAKFQEFRRELVRRGVEIGPHAGREWGDNDANRSVRMALNRDLDA